MIKLQNKNVIATIFWKHSKH